MFSVEPYEFMDDDSVFESLQSVKWGGKIWELALQNDAHPIYLYLRFRQLAGAWLAATPAIKAPFEDGRREIAPRAIWERFIECQENGRWSRSLFWNERFELRQKGEQALYGMSLSPDGTGSWGIMNAQRRRGAAFFWGKDERDYLAKSSATQLVQKLRSSPDVEFARRLLFTSRDELWNLMWKWKRGDHREFERVLAWALLAQDDLWRTLSNLSWRVNLIEDAQNNGTCLFSDQKRSNDPRNPTPLPPKLDQALATALQWFGPRLNQQSIDQHLGLQRLLGGLMRNTWCFQINPVDFTAHEQLEASVKWHDWLSHAQKELDAEKSGA